MACGPSPDAIVEQSPAVAKADEVLVMKATSDSARVNAAPAAEPMQPSDAHEAADMPAVACVETSPSPQTLPIPPSIAGVGHRQFFCGKKVRFDARLTTAVWIADSNYDRRSIVVDLSKTPFALFRKDALLMAKPTAVSTISSNCLSSLPNKAALGPVETMSPRSNYQRQLVCSTLSPSLGGPHPTTATDTEASTAAAPAETRVPDFSREASSSAAAAATDSGEMQTRPEYLGSLDSEESDSSVATDAEFSDLEESSPESANGEVERHSVEPAFFGVWKRDHSEGYEALLLNSGVPKQAAAVALKKHPVHIIDHDGAYFRLIVKNGLSKVDNTFFIGDEPSVDIVNKQRYEISMNWVDLSGSGKRDELCLSSVCRERGEEVIAIRSLTNGGNRMVLTQIVRRPKDNYEATAKHYFKRVTDRSELRSNTGPPPRNLKVNRRSR